MSADSRTVAQKKLALMDFQVGGSAHVKPLPFAVEEGGGWFNNSVHIAKALVAHQIRKLGTIEGRTDWGQELGPMSVNAFYNVHANTLFVPAALLQEPFFPRKSPSAPTNAPPAHSPQGSRDAGREDAMTLRAQAFGSIGGLLGHEMSHGFDNVGRLFGPDLVIKDWWDRATKAKYTERAQCVGRYYHSFREAGRNVDGNTTLGEDIADKGGLHTAYDAMVAHLASQGHVTSPSDLALAKIHFFEAWAQTWCHISTAKMKRDALLTDPHAPSRVRVNAGREKERERASERASE
jgi:predicted metalloendopeptidase